MVDADETRFHMIEIAPEWPKYLAPDAKGTTYLTLEEADL
jgi:hypothetical protein